MAKILRPQCPHPSFPSTSSAFSSSSPPASARPSPPHCLLFSPADLATTTNGFAQENFIVNGEHGSLYYGRPDPTHYTATAGGEELATGEQQHASSSCGSSDGEREGKPGESSRGGTLHDESSDGEREGKPSESSRGGTLHDESSDGEREGKPGESSNGGTLHDESSDGEREGKPGESSRGGTLHDESSEW
ncbi:unnamed protein product [Closterium sp. NIES-65]|nr:unnamed protein product [Closterium sp. NIES-65]